LDKRIQVLLFITELSIGGAQIALLRLLKHLNRNQFEPWVICLYNGDGALARQIKDLNISIFDLGMTKKYRWDAFLKLWLLLKKIHPQILHTWMFHANIPGRIVGRLANIPIVISSERTMGQEGSFRRITNRLTAYLADAIICVSRTVLEFSKVRIGLPASKLIQINNGIDFDAIDFSLDQVQARTQYGLPSTGFLIGAIGRPRPVKGYDVLLNAFANLVTLEPDLLLLFVGDGPDRKKLEFKAQQLNLPPRVRFMGDQSEIHKLLPALNILVSSSFHEGMSNVILEAMAAGLPVVATAVGGTPEVVVDGETGLLVPPGDPEALSQAILKLIQNPKMRKKMGLAGRERVKKHFTIQETVHQTEKLYLKLLAEKVIQN
jgi:glycosyltransferase involved in cell wall biosynthesis